MGVTPLEELPAGHHRHHQIENDATGWMFSDQRQRFGAVAGGLDIETIQKQCFGDGFADGVVVVDYQDWCC